MKMTQDDKTGAWVMMVGLLLLAFGTLTGCSGGKYYHSWPMESEPQKDAYHFHNVVQINMPSSMFHATNSLTWVERCKTRIDSPETEDEKLYPFKDCVREEQYHMSTMGSVASQFVTPTLNTAIFTAGTAYGLHAIGRGLAKSGPTVNQSGGGAQSGSSSSSSSASDASAKNMTNSGNSTSNINSGNHIQTNTNNIHVK